MLTGGHHDRRLRQLKRRRLSLERRIERAGHKWCRIPVGVVRVEDARPPMGGEGHIPKRTGNVEGRHQLIEIGNTRFGLVVIPTEIIQLRIPKRTRSQSIFDQHIAYQAGLIRMHTISVVRDDVETLFDIQGTGQRQQLIQEFLAPNIGKPPDENLGSRRLGPNDVSSPVQHLRVDRHSAISRIVLDREKLRQVWLVPDLPVMHDILAGRPVATHDRTYKAVPIGHVRRRIVLAGVLRTIGDLRCPFHSPIRRIQEHRHRLDAIVATDLNDRIHIIPEPLIPFWLDHTPPHRQPIPTNPRISRLV